MRVLTGWTARLRLRTDREVAAALAVIALAVYLALIVGHQTQWDYFGRLAEALWQGRYWLEGAPLGELDPGRGGHLYNIQPPGPTLLLLFLVPFGSSGQIEVFLAAALGALTAVPQYLALRALTVPRALAIWCTVFALFGTVLWYTAIDGRSWFTANVVGSFFACVGLWLAATRRSPVLIGLAIGMAALSRTPIGLAGPGLLLLARRDPSSLRELPRALMLFALGVAPFAAIQGVYDYARWGDPFLIYGPQSRDFAQGTFPRGPVNLSYVPRHIMAIFFSSPAFVDNQFFFLRPRAVGMAVLMGSPAFLWLARAAQVAWSAPPWRALVLCLLPVALPEFLLALWGADQYGYRYSLDYQPFLIALTAVGASWGKAGWGAVPQLFRFAVVLSLALTAYFLAAIKLYGFAQ